MTELGRPSSFTQEIADYLCGEIARGRSLRKIVEDSGMPGETTVRRWLSDNEDFRRQYARARMDQADSLADEALDITRAAKPEDAAVVRVRLDALRWYAGKVHPKVYGDSQIVKHAGHDGGELSVKLTTDQKLQRVAALTRKLGVARAAKDVDYTVIEPSKDTE